MKEIMKYKVTRKELSRVFLTGIILFVLLYSCEDIFEKDLTEETVNLIAPSDTLKTEFSTQTFYWEEVKGALSYNLQIVTVSFDQIHQFLADTNVTVPRFTINLSPGHYEWRVRAQNGSSQTAYFVRSLKIDSTLDLRKTRILLISPKENAFTNSRNIAFRWDKIYNATSYTFQIWSPDMNGSKIKDTTLNTNELQAGSNLSDGEYTWLVKASNSNTTTDPASRKLMIDRTAPKDAPVLSEPRDRVELTSWPVNLTWSRADSDGGSPLYDSVYLAADTFFTVKVKAYKTTAKSQSYNLNEDGSYFWKVVPFDEAGNKGPQSPVRKFTVNPN